MLVDSAIIIVVFRIVAVDVTGLGIEAEMFFSVDDEFDGQDAGARGIIHNCFRFDALNLESESVFIDQQYVLVVWEAVEQFADVADFQCFECQFDLPLIVG